MMETEEEELEWKSLPEGQGMWRRTVAATESQPIGLRKEEIRVEVEDSKYLIIRTEAINESSSSIITRPAMSFQRKFRLPDRINIEGISAGYQDGVLTVTVPRSFTRRSSFIEPADVPERLEVLARAA